MDRSAISRRRTTSAPASPLSITAVTRERATIVAAGGSGACSVTACPTWSARDASMPVDGSRIQKPGVPREAASVGKTVRREAST